MTIREPLRREPTALSVIPGIEWPARPGAAGQTMLAAQFQLDQSQWWTPADLLDHQMRQLRSLAQHVLATVPHYREHHPQTGRAADELLTPESFLKWPVLRKKQIQQSGNQFLSTALPPEHGELRWITTSGSTGQPLRAAGTDVSVFFQHALVLRSQFWYGLDHDSKFAAIRASVPDFPLPDWGAPANAVFRTGPLVFLSVFEDHDKQLEWLCREEPACLLAHNTNLRALLQRSHASGVAPKRLRSVLGFGDMASPELRRMAREFWNASFHDTYSCSEIGTLALQCPQHEHLHIQAERVYLEVLREDGTPCDPGETGRVLVTDLHNFAMPLIRYELGDYAQLGPPCPCGRGLPVLSHIAGRSGHIGTDPTGRRYFPHLNFGFWATLAPILQRQIVQHTPAEIEVRYVADRELSADEQSGLTHELQTAMRYPYDIRYTRLPEIRRGPGGKFDDFLSLIQSPAEKN